MVGYTDSSAVWTQNADHVLEQHGFAAARSADDRDHFATMDRQINTLQHFVGAEGLVQVGHLDFQRAEVFQTYRWSSWQHGLIHLKARPNRHQQSLPDKIEASSTTMAAANPLLAQ